VSVERVRRNGGDVWRVRWRDEQGRQRSRVVGRKRDAEGLEVELRRAKRLGNAAVLANSNETVAELAQLWWRRHAVPNLERATREGYASILDAHIIPRVGDCRLGALTPQLVADLRADLTEQGTGKPTIRKTLALLQGILERGVEWGRLPTNPARSVRKPTQRRTHVVRPLPPDTVEAIRAHLLACGRLGDATLISVLAYAGLRPGEALGLRWHDVRQRTLLVERAVSYGQLKTTKTGRARTVRLMPALADDLAAWRPPQAGGSPPHSSSPTATGGRGIPSACAAGASTPSPLPLRPRLTHARPHDLRHSFVSLLIHDGATVLDVARQAGHAATMTLDTYGHIFDERAEADRIPADKLIAEARRTHDTSTDVSVLCLPKSGPRTSIGRNPSKSGTPALGFEPRPPSLQVKCSAS
jgi:integrase